MTDKRTVRLMIAEYEIQGVQTFGWTQEPDAKQAIVIVDRDAWEGWPVRPRMLVTVYEGYGEELVQTGVWRIDSISYYNTHAKVRMTEHTERLEGGGDAHRS